MKTILLLATCLLLLLSGCCRKIVATVATEKIIVKDSIREVLRDTLIYIEIEKTVNTAVSLTTDTSVLESRFAVSTAFVVDNFLYHNLEQKAQNLPVRIKYVDRWQIKYFDRFVTKPVIVEKPLTKWQQFRMTMGGIFLGILCAGLLYFVFRMYKAIFK